MADTLSATLEELQQVERFDPPEGFREHALVRDRSLHDKAASDPEAWWAEQAEALHWFDKWDRVLNEDDPPFYKWFEGGTLNASYNCLDRHVEAGNGDKVAFHWRGEQGEERDVTYAELLRDTQKFANALKDHGIGKGDVVGIFLPMIPEVAVAMLACARIGAIHNVVFGGFSPASVKERMDFSDAKALIVPDGARRKGKTAPIKQQVDDCDIDVETTFVVRNAGLDDVPMCGGDVWFHEAMDAADDECEAVQLDAEYAALHPLHVGLDEQAEGRAAHDRRLPHRGGVDDEVRLRPPARRGRVLVLGRRRLGHRPLVHRLRPAAQRRDERHVGGRPGLPGQGHVVVDDRAVRRDALLHRADGDPGVHQVGRGVPGQARPVIDPPARHGR